MGWSSRGNEFLVLYVFVGIQTHIFLLKSQPFLLDVWQAGGEQRAGWFYNKMCSPPQLRHSMQKGSRVQEV